MTSSCAGEVMAAMIFISLPQDLHTEGRLALDDAGWERWHPVAGGKAESVILSAEEAAWLKACWLAVKSRAARGS